MKNMLTEIDTNVSYELHKWINLHKDEFNNRVRPSRHSAIMWDDDLNTYEVVIFVKRYQSDYPGQD